MKSFSHNPGHQLMLPGTSVALKVFPTRIECKDLIDEKSACFTWKMQRSLTPFTVEQDLEKKQVLIYGEDALGYFRFRIEAKEGSLYLFVEKAPIAGFSLDGFAPLHKGDKALLMEGVLQTTELFLERLFLGCNKEKKIDKIRERCNCAEILPLWFYLGQMTPKTAPVDGAARTLLLQGKERTDAFLELYLSRFSAGLSPRMNDEEFQGILPLEEKEGSPLFLLSEGAAYIRSLFFEEVLGKYHFLPSLPSKLVVGKMVGVRTEASHLIDIEWTKNKLRRICIHIQREETIYPVFPKDIQECRLKRKIREKGAILRAGESFEGKVGEKIWLDRFQK
jgi:hypothetical protein